YAIVDRVYIDGQKYYDRQDDRKRLTELAREKESLVNAERSERRTPTSTTEPAPQQPRSNEGARSLQASDDRSAELALQQRAAGRARDRRGWRGRLPRLHRRAIDDWPGRSWRRRIRRCQ